MAGSEQRLDAPSMQGGLTLEQFAAALAHVGHFPAAEANEVLTRLGIAPSRWERSSAAWMQCLAEHAKRAEEADEQQLRAFGRAFAKVRTRLKEDRPALTSIGAIGIAPEPPPAAVPEVTGKADPGVVLKDAPFSSGAPPTFELLSARPRSLTTVEPVPDVPSSALVAPTEASPAASLKGGNETVFLKVQPEAPALPFGPPAGRRPAVADDFDETLVPISAVARAEKFPFQRDGGPEEALRRARVHAGLVQGPERPVVRNPADETALPGVVPEQATLPFLVPYKDDDGETVMAKLPAEEPVLPFADSGSKPTLTLEQYASLLVDLAEEPSLHEATLGKYGFTSETKRAEDAAWRALMERNPRLTERFQKVAGVYRAWRAQGRR